MEVEVLIGGQRLAKMARVADRVDSTIYRTDGFSGDYEASCTWLASSDFSAPWFQRGQVYEHRVGGKRVWGGQLAKRDLNDDGTWSLSAVGFGALGNDRPAIYDPAGPDPLQPWTIPNDVVDYNIASLGLPWRRLTSLSATAVSDPDGKITDLATLLQRDASAKGKRFWVDSWGVVSYVSDPTTPTLMVTPNSAYVGTADPDYYSQMFGYYVSSVDGTTGQPDGWAVVPNSNTVLSNESAAQFGYRSATVDLTELGLLSSGDAQDNIDGRFTLVGGRMGFTNPVTFTAMNLRRPGCGWSSPMLTAAGVMCRIPGVMDTRTQPTTRGSIDFILGKATRYWDERYSIGEPVGLIPRNLADATAAAVKATKTTTRAA